MLPPSADLLSLTNELQTFRENPPGHHQRPLLSSENTCHLVRVSETQSSPSQPFLFFVIKCKLSRETSLQLLSEQQLLHFWVAHLFYQVFHALHYV